MLLGQSYQVLAESADAGNVYVGSPALAALPGGRLVCTYEWFRPAPLKETVPDQCDVLLSDDRGCTWRHTSSTDLLWASPFGVGDALYLIGSMRRTRDISIARSSDGGESWSAPAVLFAGRHHGAPTSVVFRDGFVYRAFETCDGPRTDWGSLVVAGDLSRDLLEPASWRMSERVPFPGVPASLTQAMYPPSAEGKVPHDSWLEGNVVDVGGDLRVVLRTTIDGHSTAGLAAVCRLEDDGRRMSYRFSQFYPMPGAQCKFHIVHDPPCRLFWTAANIATDTWQDRAPLRALGFQGPPGNERRALALMYSVDALNWLQAGFVAVSPDQLESFSYASLLPVGDDLLVVSRTSVGGRNQHDTNLITLHRVEGFRALVPDLFFAPRKRT